MFPNGGKKIIDEKGLEVGDGGGFLVDGKTPEYPSPGLGIVMHSGGVNIYGTPSNHGNGMKRVGGTPG